MYCIHDAVIIPRSRERAKQQEASLMEPKKQFEPRSKDQNQSKSPPSPVMAGLLSLFAYPGVGQMMVGHKRVGIGIVVLFTVLTLGIVGEVFLMSGPLLQLITEGVPMEQAPNWTRIGFWIFSTGVVWLGAGVHAFVVAKEQQ